MHAFEHSFSELLRQPKDVVKDLADGDVVLRRRGAPALRLSRADRDDERNFAFATVARTLRNLAVHSPEAMAEALLESLPWTSFLPDADRDEFILDFTRAATAAADVEAYTHLAQMLEEWRATARIHADPRLARRLTRPLHPKGPAVARPTA